MRESLAAFRDVFANPGLRRLQLAWAGSIVGTWAYAIAVIVFAYDHGGARAVGIVGAARWIGAGIVAPFAGVVADRFDRRLVMVASDGTRAILLVGAGVAAVSGAPAPIVYVIAALISMSSTPFRMAEAGLTPALARTPEELTAANVVSSTIGSVGMFAGPALGALLLAAAGAAVVFFTMAGAFVWSMALVISIRVPVDEARPARAHADTHTVRDELLAGARTIFGERRLTLLVGLFSAQCFVDGILNVLIAVVALELLDIGNAGVGLLNASIGVGALLGAVVAAGLVGRKRLATDFGVGIFLWGLPIALVAVWSNEVAALVLLGIVGVGCTLADVSGITLLQRSAPDEVVARVFGVLESFLLFATAAGALLAPHLLDWLGTRGALVATGILLPVLVLPSWPMLVSIDRSATVPVLRLGLLRSNAIFAPLPEATLEELAAHVEERPFTALETIFDQGDEGDRFYLVESGQIEIMVDGRPARVLGPGDAFGEIALLRDVPRTAGARATSDGVLLSLDRDAFVPAVTGFAASSDVAEAIIGRRLGPGRAGVTGV